MKTQHRKGRPSPKPTRNGASQRQLRAGELIRHALVQVLYEDELQDETMVGVSVTVTEVRLSSRSAGRTPRRWSRRSIATPASCAGGSGTPST